MKFSGAMISGLGLALVLSVAASGQTVPAQPPQWEVTDGGKTLMVKSKCGTAELEAVCKAKAGEVTGIRFDFNNEGVDSFVPVAQVKGLKSLRTMSMMAAKKGAMDVTPLAGLTELEDLDLYGTPIKNAAALGTLKKMMKLSFYMSDVDSIECVKGMPELATLSLYGFGHTFKDYTPLLGLKKLRELNIYMNKEATDELLAPLAALTSLNRIDMANDKRITTLGFLKGCKKLKKLKVSAGVAAGEIEKLKEALPRVVVEVVK
jgi:hypothetical protein